MFAAHQRLSRLVALIDLNGQQALGYTKDVLDLSNMAERWKAFGWDAHDVDGHEVPQLVRVAEGFDYSVGQPHVLVAHTTFGKGVSFMRSQIKWHYMPLTESEFQSAIEEVRATP